MVDDGLAQRNRNRREVPRCRSCSRRSARSTASGGSRTSSDEAGPSTTPVARSRRPASPWPVWKLSPGASPRRRARAPRSALERLRPVLRPAGVQPVRCAGALLGDQDRRHPGAARRAAASGSRARSTCRASGPVILAVEPPVLPRLDLHPARSSRGGSRSSRRPSTSTTAKTAWFFRGVGQIPIRREGGSASERALESRDRGARGRRRVRHLSRRARARATASCTAGTRASRGSRCAPARRSSRSGSSAATRCSRSTRSCRACSRRSRIRFGEPIDLDHYAGPRRRPARAARRRRRGDVRDRAALRLRVRRHVRDEAGPKTCPPRSRTWPRSSEAVEAAVAS